MIISLGGGSILKNEIRKKLKKNSLTVFLDVDLEELTIRLNKSLRRPLLKNVNIKKKVKQLDIERRKYYLNADIKISNFITAADACNYIIDKFLNFHEKKISNKS